MKDRIQRPDLSKNVKRPRDTTGNAKRRQILPFISKLILSFMVYKPRAKGKIAPSPRLNDEVAERLTDMGTTNTHTTNDTATQTKKTRLLSDPDIKRWHGNLARGSMITADVYLRRLGKFCETHHMTPIALKDLAIKDIKTATDLLEDHVTVMESNGNSPGYIDGFVKSVKSWLGYFDVEIKRKIKISSTGSTPTLQDERVPDGDEMSEIYSRAGLRESAVISLMAKSGLRPQVMGNHDGTDGLRIRDLPDLVIHEGKAKCVRTPSRIIVRKELSKMNNQYLTFSTKSAIGHVVAYLNDRLVRGESLHGDSPVIAPDHIYKTHRGRNSSKTFLPTQRICKLVRNTFRPRFEWRPYVLRAYFDTQLLIAESKGKIAHDFRVFFMGHKGSMESRYTTNKGRLPDVLLDEMRNAFGRSEEYLDQTGTDPSQEQRMKLQQIVEGATPESLGNMLEALKALAN